jgi:hypothetical protein
MGSRSGALYLFALLACAGLVVGCSQAPTEPAPVFTLPAYKVIDGPKIEGQAAPPPLGQAASPQLRYVAVPPGRKVSGMAQARDRQTGQGQIAPLGSRAQSEVCSSEASAKSRCNTIDQRHCRDEVKRTGEGKSQ